MYITQLLLIVHSGFRELDNDRRLRLIGVDFHGGIAAALPTAGGVYPWSCPKGRGGRLLRWRLIRHE